MSGGGWRPYWLVPAFVALMLAPAPWGVVGALTAAVVANGWRLARAVAARRPHASEPDRGAIVLGRDPRGREVLITDQELSTHGLLLGASGAGKSTTLLRILTEQIARGLPVVALDMKGSPAFARTLADAAAAAGRPFTCWSIDGPAHWNPLQHGNPTELKDKLMATERFTEPHYQRAAERYVQIVLTVLSAGRSDRAPTLAEVVSLMDPRRLPSALRTVDPGLRGRVQDYLAGLTPDQVSAARGLQTRLAVLTESHTAPYLAPGAGGAVIDLREALHGPEVVLFSLNSSKYKELAAQLGTLVVQDLVTASGDRLEANFGRAVPQATIGIDEFSALGADHVIALLARGRESRMSVLVATQEMADLNRAGFGLRDQVVGVTALKIIHRQDVPDSARMIAQMVGTEWVWEATRQTAGRLFGGYDTGHGTRRQVERFIVHPNEILSLTPGDAIVISKLRGGGPLRVRIEPPRPVPWSRAPEPPRPLPSSRAPEPPSSAPTQMPPTLVPRRAAQPWRRLGRAASPRQVPRPPPSDSLGR